MSPNHFDDLQQVFASIGWPTNAPDLNSMLPVDTGAPSPAAAELKRRFDSAYPNGRSASFDRSARRAHLVTDPVTAWVDRSNRSRLKYI